MLTINRLRFAGGSYVLRVLEEGNLYQSGMLEVLPEGRSIKFRLTYGGKELGLVIFSMEELFCSYPKILRFLENGGANEH